MIISVTQLGNFLKAMLDTEVLLFDLKVEGEISNYRQSSEVVFFVLKDENAQVECICYNPPKGKLVDGDKVIVSGRPNFYIKGGKLSFLASKIEKKDIKGDSYRQFILLKEKLEREGLFDALRKKPIIFDCKKIGVLTSASGAVIQDIRNVCQRRNPTTEILLFDCKVQGSDSENNLLRGLKYLENTDVDNIIIARGGGSSEDLSVFNSENLVYAISGCQKPVISAVGHETDFTLCDFVADCRASTPSVAAELSTVDIRAVINNFLQQFAKQIVLKQGCLENNCEQIQNYQRYLISLIVSKLTNKFDELVSIKQQLSEKMKFLISERQNIVESYLMRLDKANPAHILMKGFALLSDERGNSVNSIDKVCVDEMLMIKMHDGSIKAKVLDIEVKNEF